ncbi:unnamed protein product, partial [Phaeothamnion confervicola]
MATIYTCFRQLHPPTAIDHAAFACLTGRDATDLVVAKGLLLELYAVRGASSGENNASADSNHTPASDCFLELVGSFPLAARVEGLDVICGGGSVGDGDAEDGGVWRPDMLAVSFEGAKLALLGFDIAVGQLTTLSIHNFGPDSIGPGAGAVEPAYGVAGALRDPPPPQTAADPLGRCVAMVVGGSQLVVLPTLRSRGTAPAASHEGRT